MTYIPWFIRSLVVYSIVLPVYSKEYDALIFDSDRLGICNLNERNDLNCAIACPAQREDEEIKNFLKNINYRNTPLFIEQIDRAEKLREKNAGKCQLGFEMSALLIPNATKDETVEFGFLIFYEKSKFEEKVTAALHFLLAMDSNQVTAVSDVDSIRESTDTRIRTPQRQSLQKWGFTWVSKVDVRYNFSSRILILLDYKVDPIQKDQVEAKCHNYGLFTNEYNTDEHMDKLYAKDNQSAIFEKFEETKQSCSECVKKYNLVLPYQFQASSAGEISCSNMTTIPLWHGIPELDQILDRIEKFLIAVAQGLGEDHTLEVRTCVGGQLTLHSVDEGKLMEVYLDDKEKKVPVPNVIYKFVRYENHGYNRYVKDYARFLYIVIVVHNNPKFSPEEKLCSDDVCESLGWGSIQYPDSNKSNEGKKSKFVYCCKLNTVAKAFLPNPEGTVEEGYFHLDLKNPPPYISKRLGDKNLLNVVKTNFKKLVGE